MTMTSTMTIQKIGKNEGRKSYTKGLVIVLAVHGKILKDKPYMLQIVVAGRNSLVANSDIESIPIHPRLRGIENEQMTRM